jgi:hypothetical protein
MDTEPKKSLKNQVELAIAVLTAQIDSLREKVEKLCEATEGCNIPSKAVKQKDKK